MDTFIHWIEPCATNYSSKLKDTMTTKTNTDENKLTRSKERVRDLGEVFTPDFLVEKMLDLFPEDAWGEDKNWLEPTCGNGQFILGILRRKLSKGPFQCIGQKYSMLRPLVAHKHWMSYRR
jgi:hypothetical protein